MEELVRNACHKHIQESPCIDKETTKDKLNTNVREKDKSDHWFPLPKKYFPPSDLRKKKMHHINF